ncbi:hypothetical protein KY499_05005 [Arthrobacter sp. PAMC25284]|uniref:Lipoprotein n=1 Tax=Arthrobacter oryzae TaxID=409290 RepID=A0A3N0BRU9_9MICC|nr:hypothetical protein KY499_05005 [Arthrobacter sp. PAMC25284]RNL51539.1 hypothetical protein D7003_15510 [Arthrobacter oryzae]
MKVFGERKRIAVTASAAGIILALSACTPASSGAAGETSAAALSTAQSTTTAPPSPSAQPGTSATVGAVVSGFPEALLPLMPGAKVVSSSFDKTTVPATVALVGSIGAPTPEVLAFYTQALEAQGFKAVPGDSVGAVPSKDFLRGDNETVNISVLESAGTATFTIGANVAAESVK